MKEKIRKVLNEILTILNWETDFDLEEPPKEIRFDLADRKSVV